MRGTTLLAVTLSLALLGVATFSALGTARMAAAAPSDNCVATIKAAIADRRMTSAERDAIHAACGSSAPEDCQAAIKAAIADKRVTRAEVEAIKSACITK